MAALKVGRAMRSVEKNIELIIGRRFKRRGMTWSREGANSLLKLGIERQDPDAWQGWWQSLPWHVAGQGRAA